MLDDLSRPQHVLGLLSDNDRGTFTGLLREWFEEMSSFAANCGFSS